MWRLVLLVLISMDVAASLGIRMSVPHWRDFRARLVKQQQLTAPSQPLQEQLQLWPGRAGGRDWWVHELAVPEKGCVLLAQPHAVFVEQPHLNRGAVLVLEHDPTTCGTMVKVPSL